MTTTRDRVRELLADAVRAEGPAVFAELLAYRISAVIDADSASFNDFPRTGEPLLVRTAPFAVRDGPAIFARYYGEHPIVTHHRRTGDTRAHRFTDLITRRALHRLALYNDYYRPSRVEHQLAISLPAHASPYVAVALNRSRGRNFSDADRSLLTAIGPLLGRAYDNARLIARLREERRLVDAGLQRIGHAIVALGRDGAIRTATDLAEVWLRRYLGWRRGRLLPPRLADWLDQAMPGDRFAAAGGGGRLVVLVAREADGTTLLLLHEESSTAGATRLAEAGLSLREIEVLGWVGEGKTSPEIAAILGVSPRTVHHHLDSVYRKLGVETRTAAARRAREIAGGIR